MSDLRWTTERRRLADLIPWPRNPRQIRKDQAERLNQSLDEFGQVETIAIGPGNEVYNGHQRLNVWAAEHGPDFEVEVRVSSRPLTEKEREKLVVFLHKGAAGEWDFDTLANEFDFDELLEWGFDGRDLGIFPDVDPWRAESQEEVYLKPDGDGIAVKAGYRLSSMWYDMNPNNDARKYMLELPFREDSRRPGYKAAIGQKYSRTNPSQIERIIKTYMRPGDRFFEMCCGWMTFAASAKYFGFDGKGGDIWDVSLQFCDQQLREMPGDGDVSIIYADCRKTGEPPGEYDFIHSNPPFFSLEPYGESDEDLASLGDYGLWLAAMAEMGKEAHRILKPGGLANFVINDYRKEGNLIPMHSDFLLAIADGSPLVLHDIVVSEVNSQSMIFRAREYEKRRTVKCHEYVITFRKPA